MIDEKKLKKKAYDAARYADNREQIIERVRKNYRENSDRIKVYASSHYWRNKERHNALGKIWRENNQEKKRLADMAWRLRNLEHARARGRLYQKQNLHIWRTSWHKRRAAKLVSGECFTAEQISHILVGQKYRCVGCRKPIRKGYHIDHVMPLALGGSNGAHNIQLLCAFCNISKGAKHPLVWAKQHGRLL